MKSALKETLGDDAVRDRLRNVYACETAGHAINWTIHRGAPRVTLPGEGEHVAEMRSR